MDKGASTASGSAGVESEKPPCALGSVPYSRAVRAERESMPVAPEAMAQRLSASVTAPRPGEQSPMLSPEEGQPLVRQQTSPSPSPIPSPPPSPTPSPDPRGDAPPYFEAVADENGEIAHHRAVSDVPGVVTLHAVVEEEFYTFLVLDLCAGGDLFTAIMERGTYSNNDVAVKRTFLQLVDALAACHEAGVYHRDLKPENVLCSPGDQHVYLADFGLSTRSTRSSNFGCGSSFYMSPGTSSPTPNSPFHSHIC